MTNATPNFNPVVKSAIEKMRRNTDNDIAALIAGQEAIEAEAVARAESKSQRQRRLERDAERDQTAEAMQAALVKLQSEFDDRGAGLETWCQESMSIIEAAENIGPQQNAHLKACVRLVEKAALELMPFRKAYDTDQEFMLALRNTVNELSARLNWSLPVGVDQRKRFGIRNAGWLPPAGGDLRQTAIQKALRAPVPAPVEPSPTVEVESP